MADFAKEYFVTMVTQDHETTCWGCGLHLLLASHAPFFKCGWCGAITHQHEWKCEKKWIQWRRMRDLCFVCVVIGFMLFVIGGGVWAVYPVVFSVSLFCGFFHSIITIMLSITTLSMFSLAAFRCAGTPPDIRWGSYPTVEKGHLDNYTFCHYCSKPKSPRTHHCQSCGRCVLDMDHHCPFVGNCVGAANHRHFIAFLVSAVISAMYVSVICAYAGLHIWPPLTFQSLGRASGPSHHFAWRVLKEIVLAFLSSAMFISARGLVLVYLFVSCVSVEIGLSVLLWQQLSYIYEGKTYLSHLRSHAGDDIGEKDCKNLREFFGCPLSLSRYLPSFWNSPKRHKK